MVAAVFDQGFAQWRVLTSYLRPALVSDEKRDEQIADLAQGFQNAFKPWAMGVQDGENAEEQSQRLAGERNEHLNAILRQAADVAMLLFSHPALYRFQWRQTGLRKGTGLLTIFPALCKTTDERAVVLSNPRVLLKPYELPPQRSGGEMVVALQSDIPNI